MAIGISVKFCGMRRHKFVAPSPSIYPRPTTPSFSIFCPSITLLVSTRALNVQLDRSVPRRSRHVRSGAGKQVALQNVPWPKPSLAETPKSEFWTHAWWMWILSDMFLMAAASRNLNLSSEMSILHVWQHPMDFTNFTHFTPPQCQGSENNLKLRTSSNRIGCIIGPSSDAHSHPW